MKAIRSSMAIDRINSTFAMILGYKKNLLDSQKKGFTRCIFKKKFIFNISEVSILILEHALLIKI